ncbi:VOC family protein [Nitrosococcus watsonii]|uniref:VOC family protein n=1 Tax=Nitrosococcus watsonii TaxID=473531 RepID=UPI0002E45E3E|nr:hypothetical protein [Nitrosococcus watsonii]
MARFPFFHSYIGIQPAAGGEIVRHADKKPGIHHLALWARNRREVDRFHQEFLLANDVNVTDAPTEYPTYTPGYYAVFFDDPFTGIHFELAHTPLIPSIPAYLKWRKTLKQEWKQHLEMKEPLWKAAMRDLPK